MAQLVFVDPPQREIGRIDRVANGRPTISTAAQGTPDGPLVVVGGVGLRSCGEPGDLAVGAGRRGGAVPVRGLAFERIFHLPENGAGRHGGARQRRRLRERRRHRGAAHRGPTESDIAAESDIMEDETTDTLSGIVDATVSSEASARPLRHAVCPRRGRAHRRTLRGDGKHPAKGIGGGFGGGVRTADRLGKSVFRQATPSRPMPNNSTLSASS